MNKIRIGIMIRDFESLENWELRIIEAVKNDPNLELALLMRDGRSTGELKKRKLTISQKLSQCIWKRQQRIEKGRYLKNKHLVNKKELVYYLNTIPMLKLNPKSEFNLDHFNADDIGKVRKYNLDVILKHEFNAIDGGMVYAAKHGIWYLTHSDQSLKKGGIAGFWEVLNKEPVISVSLFKLNFNGEGDLIDRAHFNRNPTSAIITNSIAKESSVSFLLKYLRNLKISSINRVEEPACFKFYNNYSELINTIKYCVNFYLNIYSFKLQRLFGSQDKGQMSWRLFFGKGNFIEQDLKSIKSFNPPIGEFWADPFLFHYQDEIYVFFENYSYTNRRGKISCGRIENESLVDICDVLDLPYHLSYPFIFQENDKIYLMPETMQNKRLEIYRCISFPYQWEICQTAFEGEFIMDAFFFDDNKNKKWLFLNKIDSLNDSRTSSLYIYHIDSIELNSIIPHQRNPVIIDSKIARNGGAIFQMGGNVFRPSQDNTSGLYGRALNINKIVELSIDEYKEETVNKIEPNFQTDYLSIHHLHQTADRFIFDGHFISKRQNINL